MLSTTTFKVLVSACAFADLLTLHGMYVTCLTCAVDMCREKALFSIHWPEVCLQQLIVRCWQLTPSLTTLSSEALVRLRG